MLEVERDTLLVWKFAGRYNVFQEGELILRKAPAL